MHKVKTKIWRVVGQKHAYFVIFSMVIIKKLLSEKIFKKFPEISRNFPREISELTPLPKIPQYVLR